MNDVSSPPYPSINSLAPTLYRHLIDFREWWDEHRAQLRELLGHPFPDRVEDDPNWFDDTDPTQVASESSWDAVSVMDKARGLLYMRNIREYWDSIIRDHEDAWEAEISVRRQIDILYMGRSFLNGVFLTSEEREARMMKMRAEDQDREPSEMPEFDDMPIELPDDFNIIDIVGEDFDPEAEGKPDESPEPVDDDDDPFEEDDA